MSSLTYEVRLERRIRALSRFAEGPAVLAIPRALLTPYSKAEWRALQPSVRRAHLETRAAEEVLAEDRAPLAPAKLERQMPSVPQPPAISARPEFIAGRYYVACCDGCGTWYRAKPGRAIRRLCAGK